MSARAKRFDAIYSANADPWSFATSDYERRKYAATLAALPRKRYANVLEVGCSIGVFTNALAERSEALVALDLSSVALTEAMARSTATNVTFVHAEVPADWPTGSFDLIVFSEVLYFLNAAEIERCAQQSISALRPGGDIILINWLGTNDCELSGNAAARLFATTAGAQNMAHRCLRRHQLYQIDLISSKVTEVDDF